MARGESARRLVSKLAWPLRPFPAAAPLGGPISSTRHTDPKTNIRHDTPLTYEPNEALLDTILQWKTAPEQLQALQLYDSPSDGGGAGGDGAGGDAEVEASGLRRELLLMGVAPDTLGAAGLDELRAMRAPPAAVDVEGAAEEAAEEAAHLPASARDARAAWARVRQAVGTPAALRGASVEVTVEGLPSPPSRPAQLLRLLTPGGSLLFAGEGAAARQQLALDRLSRSGFSSASSLPAAQGIQAAEVQLAPHESATPTDQV